MKDKMINKHILTALIILSILLIIPIIYFIYQGKKDELNKIKMKEELKELKDKWIQEVDGINRIKLSIFLKVNENKYKNINDLKKAIYKEFGDSIPSIKQDLITDSRDRKINSILN